MTSLLEKDFKMNNNKEILPLHEFLHKSASNCCASCNYVPSSAVMPSLPLTIKWLRECLKEHPYTRLQVTVDADGTAFLY